MKYDYLKMKYYDERIEEEGTQKFYILSFSNEQHIKVSEKAKKIMDLFNGMNTLEKIEEELRIQNIKVEKEELRKFVSDILYGKALIEGTEYKGSNKNKMLWFKLPLIDSTKLSFLFNILKYLFNKKIMILSVVIFILNLIVSTIISLNSGIFLKSTSSIKIIVIVYISLILHELGHATAAKKCGIDAGKIGIGLYFISPVMFVDITNAWRVDHKKRVLIDIGGVYFQAITTIFLSMLALITSNKIYYLCNVSISVMILYNMMPFLKLDGYWIFCDYFKISNVSSNAFQVIKLKLSHLIRNQKDSSIVNDKRTKVYYIFSFIYGFSTFSAMIMGCVYSIKIIQNRQYVIKTSKLIVDNFIKNNFMQAFTDLNSILIYIIPLIFIGVMVLKVFIKIIKGVLNNDRIEEHN